LRLEDEKAGGQAGRLLLFFRFQLLFLQLARRARRPDTLLVGSDLPGGITHLRGDLQLKVLDLGLSLL
jgi:hypothetical protein